MDGILRDGWNTKGNDWPIGRVKSNLYRIQ